MTDTPQRILVVEDEPAFLRVIQFTLERAGFAVTTALNGRLAWEWLAEQHADLVVTDHQMPEMTGSELCERIRRDPRFSQTPVVMLTAKGYELDKTFIRQEIGVTEFMNKPFSPHQLLDTVRHCLATRTAEA